MPWDVVIFFLIASVAVLCAGGVVVATNPVHSAIFLVLCFFNVAGIFVMMGAEFLAAIQVIVYTGAVLVLVLFVLMLVDPDDLPEFHQGRPVQRAVGGLLGLILMLEIAAAVLARTVVGVQGTATVQAINDVGGNTQALGRLLYSEYLLPFEVISLVLTVGVIGAIVLALPERLGERIGPRRGTISLAHVKGTDTTPSLESGTFGESPIPVAKEKIAAQGTGGRKLIMVKDAEQYTGAKPRR
jgi:NADH-quinone oxidoreductase subunit J